MNVHDHIRIMRNKQRLVPPFAEKYAQAMFKEMIHDDGYQDEILDLVVDIHEIGPLDPISLDATSDLEVETEKMVWDHICNRLREIAREHFTEG